MSIDESLAQLAADAESKRAALEIENERLRAALKEIAEQDMVTTGTKDGTRYVRPMTASDAADIARQALEEAKP